MAETRPGTDGPPAFGVAGSPIAHSLSPLLHSAAAAALGLEGFTYTRIEITEDELAGVLDARPDLAGLSVTMPLKLRLVEVARTRGWRIHPAVEATGAANTLLRSPSLPGGGEILNTDVTGIVTAVHEGVDRGRDVGRQLPGTWGTVDVLGAGATAGSALAAAAHLGAAHAHLFVRNRNRAGRAREVAEAVGLTTELHDLADWVPGERGLTLSTLPAGALGPGPGGIDVAVPPRIDALVFDAAYAAEAAAWHRMLLSHGAFVVDGSRMLLHQAVAQHVRFARLAGLSAQESQEAGPRILQAMDAALAGR